MYKKVAEIVGTTLEKQTVDGTITREKFLTISLEIAGKVADLKTRERLPRAEKTIISGRPVDEQFKFARPTKPDDYDDEEPSKTI